MANARQPRRGCGRDRAVRNGTSRNRVAVEGVSRTLTQGSWCLATLGLADGTPLAFNSLASAFGNPGLEFRLQPVARPDRLKAELQTRCIAACMTFQTDPESQGAFVGSPAIQGWVWGKDGSECWQGRQSGCDKEWLFGRPGGTRCHAGVGAQR